MNVGRRNQLWRHYSLENHLKYIIKRLSGLTADDRHKLCVVHSTRRDNIVNAPGNQQTENSNGFVLLVKLKASKLPES